MEYVLETNAVTKRYRGFTALSGLTMRIPKGAIYGFVGRNGAGKTTLIRIICGLQEPTNGSYTLYGVKNTEPQIIRSRRRMGAVVESPAIYPDMTARENIRQQYRVLGLPSDDGIDELLHLVGLGDTGKKKAKNFSLGMRQRLGIAIALSGNPDFLVLDEPTNGLDPQGIADIRALVQELNEQYGMTVIISSHILGELQHTAHRFGIVNEGTVPRTITQEDLLSEQKAVRIRVDDLERARAALRAAGIPILNEVQETRSLEDFYFGLVGGEENA